MTQDEAIDIMMRLHTAAIALDAARALAEQVAGQYDRIDIHNLCIGCCEQMERIAQEHGLPVPMLGATEI
jgi:hypothetical protein